MNYAKRIVVDFDDTLSFTKNRDWENARPNLVLIEKLNDLHDAGWTIDIFTARGSISCKTREESFETYHPVMVLWLEKHGVKYNSISFQKPLAAYYIDDKAITPDDFINIEIEQLQGGLSGSDIYTDGEYVHKTDSHSYEVAEWFKIAAQNLIPVPRITRVISDTITMEYIDHSPLFFKCNKYIGLGHIQEALRRMKQIPVIRKFTFDSYVDRIWQHANLADNEILRDVAHNIGNLELKQSFGHGDFGVTNMLFSNGLVLIDPIPYTFTCTELDIAKFLASLLINHYDHEYYSTSLKTLCMQNNLDESTIVLLACSELTRVHKYLDTTEKQLQLTQNISLLLNSMERDNVL